MMCQLPSLERLAQQRRARELVADELGPLRGDDEEADERLVGRDPGVPAEQRLAEHRRPFDLEQEARPCRGRTRSQSTSARSSTARLIPPR